MAVIIMILDQYVLAYDGLHGGSSRLLALSLKAFGDYPIRRTT